jgi:ATP-dependent helicase/nuclease subunit B
VQATFLIGPAGAGKTFRCLAEVRAALKKSADGLPLLFLAPKQATYQLERELLDGPELHGYTRLQILSFERLARFVLSQSPGGSAEVLSEGGRVMVLRALLARHEGDLKVFRGSARMAGFARQLGDCIAELQSHRISPAMLLAAADKLGSNGPLADKLRDLGLIFQAYLDWLKRQQLHDIGSLLDLATDSVRSGVLRKRFRWQGLWLDGFPELTPQETALLLAVLPACQHATLAFCTDSLEAREHDWLSPWVITAVAAVKCLEAVRMLSDATVRVDQLRRRTGLNRFSNSNVLADLEAGWETQAPSTFSCGELARALRVVSCANPEAEAALAAQEILHHVRAGGRFRDCGVILRDLNLHRDAIRRVFTRSDIPFFIDRREPVTHHPLPELTRAVLRLAAFDWQLDDWLSALKTGLVTDNESDVDALENEALERGWSGRTWQQPLAASRGVARLEPLERLRQRVVPPFVRFTEVLRQHAAGVSGAELVDALDQLWNDLNLPHTLARWGESADAEERDGAVHRTVWEQMQAWLNDLALAFPVERLALREWIAIVDAGLIGFTVGVVPPALDQVLVGTVDRSRNPNLELAIVLGLNESVFPAPPTQPALLNETDREQLAPQLFLGPSSRARLGHERYYGYIACTRARRRLVLSYSGFDPMDRQLNPSVFISRVQRIFPALELEVWRSPATWLDAEHSADVLRAVAAEEGELPPSSAFEPLRTRLQRLRALSLGDTLSREAAEQLYGRDLQTSITSLERFGECPFKFLVHSGLRAQERKLFQIDRKKLGDFQHRVLKAFHDQLRAEGKQWRHITPAEARLRVARVSEEEARNYHHGLFATSARQRFAVRQLSLALQDFVEVLVGWMTQYRFDPAAAELRFASDGDVPAWRLDLSNGRALICTGSIDRVDLVRQHDRTALCVVLDFKSSPKKIEPQFLHNGVQMQLPAYLNMLRRLANPRDRFGVAKLQPAGLFYVCWRGSFQRAEHRNHVLPHRVELRREAYQHAGRFDVTALDLLDATRAGDQFKYSLRRDGVPDNRLADPMEPEQFIALLDTVEARLRDFGERIFAGEAAVAPYRRNTDTPCTFCDYQPVCRIDPWTHQYRSLEPAPDAW